MGIWFRNSPPIPERRSADWVGGSPFVATGQSYSNVYGGRIETAQQAVAVRAAVDLIASICSELPVDIWSGTGPARRQVRMPSYLEDPAGDGHGLADWIYQVIYSWAYRGNAYGNILGRGPGGMLTQVDLLWPDSVHGRLEGGEVVWSVSGQDIPTANVMHRRVNPVPGQVLGLSVITVHADTIGVQLATSRFGKSFFDADAHPLGILRNTKASLDPDQAQTIKDRFMAALRAGSSKREPVVMGQAYEWQQIQVNPEESQFLETLGYSAAECARIFGPGIPEILGYETGGSQTYANLQDRDLQLLKYSINKWLLRLERLLFLFLPRPQYAVFNRDALLQTNTLTRYQAFASALGGKPWKSVNEVRDLELLPPVEGGDEVGTDPAPAATPAADGTDQQDNQEGVAP